MQTKPWKAYPGSKCYSCSELVYELKAVLKFLCLPDYGKLETNYSNIKATECTEKAVSV